MPRKVAWWRGDVKPARRLSQLAEVINGDKRFTARIEKGYCNTDTQVAGTRFRRPGKGRRGNQLIVMMGSVKVLDHNSAETYRSNYEVEAWVKQHVRTTKKCGRDYCKACEDRR